MEPIHFLGKFLLIAGLVLVVVGLVLIFWDKFPLNRFPIGRLPGDIIVKKPGYTLYFPWVTGLVISLIISIILYILRR